VANRAHVAGFASDAAMLYGAVGGDERGHAELGDLGLGLSLWRGGQIGLRQGDHWAKGGQTGQGQQRIDAEDQGGIAGHKQTCRGRGVRGAAYNGSAMVPL
jgi:hypothetical protein